MKIEELRLTVSDKDVNEMIVNWMPEDVPVSGLKAKIVEEGLDLKGVYEHEANLPIIGKKAIRVRFETLWSVSVQKGKIAARLAELEAAGLPAGSLRGLLLGVIASALEQETGIDVSDETILLDIDCFLEEKGIPIRTGLKKVETGPGELTVEAGARKRPTKRKPKSKSR